MKLPIPFDNPRTYKGHSGVDYGQPRGTPFRASGPGVVTTLGNNARGGFYIWVQYDNGPRVGYHHMDSHRGCPKPRTRVVEGTLLGYVGSLGKFSTGPHLHSEVYGHATTAGYWRFFDRNRVVGQPTPAQEDDMPLTDTDIQKVARAVWEYESRTNGRKFGDMVRRAFQVGEALYESVRYGKKGVRTHGTGTADVLSRLGAIQLQMEAVQKQLDQSSGIRHGIAFETPTDATDG